ncbi:hypothetical protein TRAPUB_2675 [Trametes pubescens]|uniref:F-box domain-containing protein n=1 Tax=Trametes pubescens TaxID=154538 RepID=A0A1M2VFS1_TRAPU|nr:hypothetical protein TRAPUB_2675 [Trametes pubescens]
MAGMKHVALHDADILELIVEHLAPGKECTSEAQRQPISALARVSKAFHIPATKALWARLPSLHHLLLLLPEFDTMYRAYRTEHPFGDLKDVRLSERVSPATWARFRNRAAAVRHLSQGRFSDVLVLHDESWSYLARLLGDHGPLFPSLRTVSGWQPTTSCEDLRLLACPLLQSVAIYHAFTDQGWAGSCPLAVQDVLINAPGLTDLKLVSCSDDFFTHITPEALAQLRSLWFEVDQPTDCAPREWYPNAAALRVLSALPALEHLRVELALDYNDTEFMGFGSLITLCILDSGCGDATWFLERCSSPRLRELTIDLTNLYFQEFEWEDMHPLCVAIAGHTPQLRELQIFFGFFGEMPEQIPDMLLTAAHPLFALRHLTTLSLWLSYGEFILSDSVLEAFAEAWPALVSLEICFSTFRPYTPGGLPRPHPASVTLRSFHALSRHCPHLQVLHIPHLYVPPEDCYGSVNVDGAEHSPGHQLWKMAICRAFIVDAHACAQVLHHIFPHLDVGHSRAAYLRSHDACQEDHFFRTAWLNTLDALEGCQTSTSNAELSYHDASQCESSGR